MDKHRKEKPMSMNDIYIRLRQECSQAVLSGCQDLILECRGKAKMAYELGRSIRKTSMNCGNC